MGSPKIDRLISDFRNLSDQEILFEENEIEILNRIKDKVIPEKIIYCSFENRYAKSGGLAAVVTSLLPHLDYMVKNKSESENPEVILLTPFHSRQKAFQDALKSESLTKKTNFNMPYKGKEINVDIYEFNWDYDLGSGKTGTIKEYYLKADNIFETQNTLGDPYIYDTEDSMRNNDLIIRDSIFFCKAAPFALKHLGYCENIIFHLQEWQTALLAVTSKLAMLPGRLDKDILLKSCACIQTMHNTFDSYESPGFFLEQFKNIANYGDEDKLYLLSYKHILEKSFSEYSIGLSFIDKEITTVSKCFAEEITTDILHTEYFAPHLQSKLKARGNVKGVNNGMFIKIPREFDFVFDKNQDEKEKINKLKDIKLKNRKNLLSILRMYNSKNIFVKLLYILKEIKLKNRKDLLTSLSDFNYENTFGKLLYKDMEITKLPENVPICVMSGRLDPSQKGYDILLKVIDEFHNEQIKNGEEKIKFILTPMPIKPGDLDYFKEIAGKCKGNLLVIAERMKKGYLELQLGSTFGLMPSIFEPFGAAIEYMVNGTLVIARNTGGLRDQITDGVDGLLYSESSPGTKSAEYNIENIRHYFQYRNNVKVPLAENNWAKEMVQSLKTKIEDAITIFNNPDQYFHMVLKGFEKAKEFSWDKSAEEYYEYYKKI